MRARGQTTSEAASSRCLRVFGLQTIASFVDRLSGPNCRSEAISDKEGEVRLLEGGGADEGLGGQQCFRLRYRKYFSAAVLGGQLDGHEACTLAGIYNYLYKSF